MIPGMGENVAIGKGCVYVDRDWWQGNSAPARTISVGVDGAVTYGNSKSIGSGGETADSQAAQAIVQLASSAASLVADLQPADIRVLGAGAVAWTTRRIIGIGEDDAGSVSVKSKRSPAAIIDATGRPDILAQATREVRTLGRVVLAGFAAARPFPFDLYHDVHKRGLTLVGAPWPDGGSLDAHGLSLAADLVSNHPPASASVWAGHSDRRWFRVTTDYLLATM